MTLPTGQSKGTLLSVEKIDSSASVQSVTGNLPGAVDSTLTMPLAHESVLFETDSSGNWWPIASHKPLAGLDARNDLRYVTSNAQTLDARFLGCALNGTTDDSAALNTIIATANAGTIKHILVTGTALVSAPLTALTAGVILEFRNGGIKVASSYSSSTTVIPLAGVFSELRGNFQLSGGSTANASVIYVAPTAIGSHVEAINTNSFTGGWLLEAECGVSNRAPNGFSLNSVRAQNVNYGIWIHGHCGQPDNDLQGMLTDLNIQTCVHDCLRIEDVSDVQISLIDFATTGTPTGAADLHIVSACSSINVDNVDNVDIGVYPATLTTVTQPTVWIEGNSNGAPLDVQILGGIIQAGFNNLRVDAGDAIVARNIRFQGSGASNVKVTSTTSSRVLLDQCQFVNSNAQGATAADVEVTSSATLRVRSAEHYTPIGTATAGAVPTSYLVPLANNVAADRPEFHCSGASMTTAFSNPVRGSVLYAMTNSPTEIPARVRGANGQSASLFQVENYLGGQQFGITASGQMAALKGAFRGVSAKSRDYTLNASGGDDVIVFTIAVTHTATMPSAAVVGTGRVMTVINASASTVALTLASNGGTVPTASLAVGTAISLVSDGTNWQRCA